MSRKNAVSARSAVRNRTMGIKVTDEEYEQLEALAEARGQTMSDWGREVLLANPPGMTWCWPR